MTPWGKWLADLSGTRTQLTYLFAGLTAAAFIKGLMLAKTVTEVVALMGAAMPILSGVLLWHFGGKWLVMKNGQQG